MCKRSFFYLFFYLAAFSCSTEPKNMEEDSTQKNNAVPKDAIDQSEEGTAIIAMADITSTLNEKFSGKAYLIKENKNYHLTIILNNLMQGKYEVYLHSNCNNGLLKETIPPDDLLTGKMGELAISNENKGQADIQMNHLTQHQEQQINGYFIKVINNEKTIVGCGRLKEYKEEIELGNAAY